MRARALVLADARVRITVTSALGAGRKTAGRHVAAPLSLDKGKRSAYGIVKMAQFYARVLVWG